MRYCDADGRLDFAHNGPPGAQPATLMPWYELRDMGEAHIVFGHWASLGFVRREGFSCVDTGCVWGRTLTALPLNPPGEPVSVPCVDAERRLREAIAEVVDDNLAEANIVDGEIVENRLS